MHFETNGACEVEFHLDCKQTPQVLLSLSQSAILATPRNEMIALSRSKTRAAVFVVKNTGARTAITRDIVFTIEVQHKPGEGTEFTISLPLTWQVVTFGSVQDSQA